jgi:hypothetical protein
MTLRRGFKAEANAHAVTLRNELNLSPHAPLCPWTLAEYLDIPVIPLSDLKSYERRAVEYLSGPGRDYFSAVTVFVGRHGRSRLICHNDTHAQVRQAADLAHELAHAILCHPATPPFVVDAAAEEEAHWLGPSLLVSEAAALHIVRQAIPRNEAALSYGVSLKLLHMRINVTGAERRVKRRRGA